MEGNFLSENAERSFPFLAGYANTETGSLQLLPLSTIVDFGALFGARSPYVPGTHAVWLSEVRRVADALLFEFHTDAPGAGNQPLVFSRELTSPSPMFEHADSDAGHEESLSVSVPSCEYGQTAWSGYLVTGDLTELVALLPTNGDSLSGTLLVEPALSRGLSGQFVTSVGVANADRTRVTAPDLCQQPELEFEQQAMYVRSGCIIGKLRFQPGYNCYITQTDADNSLEISGVVGGGSGEPCVEVELFDGESPPTGSSLLTGGPSCSEVVRSINGAGGKVVQAHAGNGVTITPDNENHVLRVNIDLRNLAACVDVPDETAIEECAEVSLPTGGCGNA